MICDYGCGREAKYQFKNEKWCCKDNVAKCPGARKKISEALKGENNPMFGKSPSEETRKKHSEAKKGKSPSKETRKKQSEAQKGRSYEELHGKEKAEEIRKKQSEVQKGRSRKPFSKEHKKKMRISAIKRIEKNRGQISPNYNPEACKLIEKYGKKNGYNFQHAENGGELYIQNLGYWVDGYDKNKNVVVEIDEPHHFDVYGNLYVKDIQRQQEIINFLGCEFIRLEI